MEPGSVLNKHNMMSACGGGGGLGVCVCVCQTVAVIILQVSFQPPLNNPDKST